MSIALLVSGWNKLTITMILREMYILDIYVVCITSHKQHGTLCQLVLSSGCGRVRGTRDGERRRSVTLCLHSALLSFNDHRLILYTSFSSTARLEITQKNKQNIFVNTETKWQLIFFIFQFWKKLKQAAISNLICFPLLVFWLLLVIGLISEFLKQIPIPFLYWRYSKVDSSFRYLTLRISVVSIIDSTLALSLFHGQCH